LLVLWKYSTVLRVPFEKLRQRGPQPRASPPSAVLETVLMMKMMMEALTNWLINNARGMFLETSDFLFFFRM
jgi:hypothetical protein